MGSRVGVNVLTHVVVAVTVVAAAVAFVWRRWLQSSPTSAKARSLRWGLLESIPSPASSSRPCSPTSLLCGKLRLCAILCFGGGKEPIKNLHKPVIMTQTSQGGRYAISRKTTKAEERGGSCLVHFVWVDRSPKGQLREIQLQRNLEKLLLR